MELRDQRYRRYSRRGERRPSEFQNCVWKTVSLFFLSLFDFFLRHQMRLYDLPIARVIEFEGNKEIDAEPGIRFAIPFDQLRSPHTQPRYLHRANDSVRRSPTECDAMPSSVGLSLRFRFTSLLASPPAARPLPSGASALPTDHPVVGRRKFRCVFLRPSGWRRLSPAPKQVPKSRYRMTNLQDRFLRLDLHDLGRRSRRRIPISCAAK